jgi:hypothetical protein
VPRRNTPSKPATSGGASSSRAATHYNFDVENGCACATINITDAATQGNFFAVHISFGCFCFRMAGPLTFWKSMHSAPPPNRRAGARSTS